MMKSTRPKRYEDIDYEFRQGSYWASPVDPLKAILRNIKGRNRREMIRDYYSAGRAPKLCDELLKDSLNDWSRDRLGQIHPTFMGGEYLPNYYRDEIEIACISLESTTSDVISLRARPSDSRIKYRVADEYQTEFSIPQQTSMRPFSLRELIQFLDAIEHPEADLSWKRSGSSFSDNQCNLDCGADLENPPDFTNVSSDC
jgi:hypothetical protein